MLLLALRNMNSRKRCITLQDSETKYPLPLIEKEVMESAHPFCCQPVKEKSTRVVGDVLAGKAGQWDRSFRASSLLPTACVCVCVCVYICVFRGSPK